MRLPSLLRRPAEPAEPTTAPAPQAAPLNADEVDAVRFNVSTPRGYYFPQVDEFHRRALAALRFYEELVHSLNQRIHALSVELDLQTADNLGLKNQIEVFKVQGSPVVNADGSFVRESQTGEPDSQRALAQAITERDEARAQAAQAEQDRLDLHRAYTELQQWADQVTVHLDKAQAQSQMLEAALQRVADLEAAARNTHAVRTEQREDPTTVDPGPDTDAKSYLQFGDDDLVSAPAVIPVDSELPPGTHTPARAQAASPTPVPIPLTPEGPATAVVDAPIASPAPAPRLLGGR